MGLDDAVFNNKVDEKVLQLCLEAGILNYWSDEATSPNVDEALLDKWEKKLCYTGYSVAFHAVLPFVTIEVMGCSPFFVTNEGENNIPERQMKDIRRKLRGRLLKIFRGPIKKQKIEQIHRMVDQRLISEEMGREQLRKFGVGNTTEGGAVSAAAVADVCANCGKKEGEGNNIKLKRCLACKEAQYCGSQCQKEHWKKHKKECRNKSKSTTGE